MHMAKQVTSHETDLQESTQYVYAFIYIFTLFAILRYRGEGSIATHFMAFLRQRLDRIHTNVFL